MWPSKRKEKIEDKQKIKAVKLGDKFNLEPGETASVDIPIPIEIIDGRIDMPGNIGKIVARFGDKYGNIYEIETNVDIKDIIEKGTKKKIKGDARIIYYGPFKKRIHMILITILSVGLVGVVAYLVTNSLIPIIIGMGVVIVLTIITEIFRKKVNEKYKRAHRYDNVRIDIVKEV